jgi:hypothetical protein
MLHPFRQEKFYLWKWSKIIFVSKAENSVKKIFYPLKYARKSRFFTEFSVFDKKDFLPFLKVKLFRSKWVNIWLGGFFSNEILCFLSFLVSGQFFRQSYIGLNSIETLEKLNPFLLYKTLSQMSGIEKIVFFQNPHWQS